MRWQNLFESLLLRTFPGRQFVARFDIINTCEQQLGMASNLLFSNSSRTELSKVELELSRTSGVELELSPVESNYQTFYTNCVKNDSFSRFLCKNFFETPTKKLNNFKKIWNLLFLVKLLSLRTLCRTSNFFELPFYGTKTRTFEFEAVPIPQQ